METIKKILLFLYERDGVFEQLCTGLPFGYMIAAILGIIFAEDNLLVFGFTMATIHVVAIFPYFIFAIFAEKLFDVKLLP